MKPSVLFLSHNPHMVHLTWAEAVEARIRILKLNWIVNLTKKIPLIGYFYPFVSLIYSFFIKVDEDILLVDGGSSLYSAVFIKLIHPRIKIIFLDGDLFFYKLKERSSWPVSFFYKKLDGIISVSLQSKEKALQYVNIPVKVTEPFPKSVNRQDVARKNFGLYVGRLDPDKNIKRILAFAKQCPYFEKFFIVGSGTMENFVKHEARQNKKIIFLGYQDKVDYFYSNCKFLVHIPDADPHPCAPMEAALCGCFPIISEGVGSKYLFDKMFIVKDPNDFIKINGTIKNILNRESKSRKILKDSTRAFPTKETSIKKFQEAFNEIVIKIQ